MAENQPYKESDDHVPSSTDIVDQLDTTATGGPSRLDQVVPIFAQTAAQNLVEASDALKDDDPLRRANVILPLDPIEQEKAVDRLHAKADVHREEGVVAPAEIQAAALRAGAGPAGGDILGTPAATGPGDAGAPSTLVSNAGTTPLRTDLSTTAADVPPEETGWDGKHEPETTTAPVAVANATANANLGSQTTGTATDTSTSRSGGDDEGSSTSTTAPSTSSTEYDPSKYGVTEVQKYMDEHPDQADAIKKAEFEGVEGGGQPKHRSTVRDYKVVGA